MDLHSWWYRRLRSADVVIHSWWCGHLRSIDIAAAAGFTVLDTGLTLAGASWWPARPGPLAWAMLGLQAAVCATLAVRRRAPLLVVGVLAAYTLALSLLIFPVGALTPAHDGNVWAPFATVIAAYGPLFYQPNRRAGLAAVAVLSLVVMRPWQPSVAVLTVGLARTAAGPLIALYADARRRLVVALRERAERAEREQHLLAEQARAQERARIASEMHDVVTHRVSLMVLQAGALRVTAPDEATRQAAEDLRAAGCQALDELRDLVGILSAGPAAAAPPERTGLLPPGGGPARGPADPGRLPPERARPQPPDGLAPLPDGLTQPPDGLMALPPEGSAALPPGGLAALAAESTSVGTPAELTEAGDPALASPVVRRTVYRIVREGLTNVRKHAPGALVTVRVSYASATVALTVRNTAPPGPAGPLGGGGAGPGAGLAATGSGLGLAGLRQRVELVHGTLRAGSTPDGGFCLNATLPAWVPTPEPAS